MKVVIVDNYDRDTVSDRLLAENLSEKEAREKADKFNNSHPGSEYAVVKPDDYVLYKYEP